MSNRQPAAVKARAAQLTALVSAVWQGITARDAAIAAYAAAGVEDEDTKNYVMRTYVARRLNPNAVTCTAAMLDEAKRILALPGATSQAAEKRTVEQEKFCNGGRQFLFGIRKSAGVEASDNRGGANNTSENAPRAPKAPAARNPVADVPTSAAGTPSQREPKYETGLELRAHFYHVARTLGMMVEKYNSITDAKTAAVINRFVKDTAGWAPKTDA